MKFKAPFILPTKDFKNSEQVYLDVTSNIERIFDGDVEFKVSIPDYIFDELADSQPKYRTTYDINNRNISGHFPELTVRRKFQKTQTSSSLGVLKRYFSELTSELNEKYSLETESAKKKIFFKFSHAEHHDRNDLNGAYKGLKVSQSFQYFIGYEIMTTKFNSLLSDGKPIKKYVSKIKYSTGSTAHLDTGFEEKDGLSLPLNPINQSVKDFENDYIIIDYTEEREAFCKRIEQTFIKVNNELSIFLKEITNDKIDELIANTTSSIPFLLRSSDN